MNYRIFVNKKSSRPDRINYTNRIGKSSQTKILQILKKYSLKSYSQDRKNLPKLCRSRPRSRYGSSMLQVTRDWEREEFLRDCPDMVVSRELYVREHPYQNPNNQNNVLNKLRK